MMLYILLITIMLLITISYLANSKEILSPTIILSTGYLICVLVAILNINQWGDIKVNTYFIVLISIIAFLIGELFGTEVSKKVNGNYKTLQPSKIIFIISKKQVFLISIFMIYIAYLYFKYTYNLSRIGGNPGGFINMLSYARLVDTNNIEFEKIGFFLKYGLYFSRAYTYYIIYCIIHNYFTFGWKRIPLYLTAPIIIYFIQSVLSTGRTQIIYLIVYIFMLSVIYIKMNNNWSNKNDYKIFKRGIISIVLILIFFWIIDTTLRGSIYGTSRDLFTTLSKYISSSLIALDYFVNNSGDSDSFGKETLYNFYSLLNRVGFDFEVYSSPLEFTTFGNISTNVYTALRRYINDFGILGMIIIQFAQGYIYAYYFNSIKHGKYIGKRLLFYCMLIYPVCFSFIEERFFTNILSLPTLAIVFFILIIWRFKKIKVIVDGDTNNSI
jgi:oligosaccharide repeat unit polymerase